jgi:hypothetical protein
MVMPAAEKLDIERARQIWSDYQKKHDVSQFKGQAVGIDPVSGGVWFGETAKEIVHKLESEKRLVPLYFLRVGFDYYKRKGGRR